VGKGKISIPPGQQTLGVQPTTSHFTIILGHFYNPVHSFTISLSLRWFTILTHLLSPDFVTGFETRCDEVVSTVVITKVEGIPYMQVKL
jgi:hypothetical protein